VTGNAGPENYDQIAGVENDIKSYLIAVKLCSLSGTHLSRTTKIKNRCTHCSKSFKVSTEEYIKFYIGAFLSCC